MTKSKKLLSIFLLAPFFVLTQKVNPIFQTGHFSKINEVLFHSNNQNLISAGDDGKIIVWDINLGLQYAEVLAHYSGVNDIDLINDSTLISLGKDNDVSIWSFPNLKLKSNFIIPIDKIQAFAVIENIRVCLVGKSVHFFSLKTKEIETTNYRSKGLFNSVDFSEDRQEIVVTGEKDNYAVTININDPIQFYKYHIGNIHEALFRDNQLLLATSNGLLQYVNLETNKKKNFSLIDDLNYATAMSSSNNLIAMGTAFGFTSIFSSDKQNIIANIGLNGIAITAIDYSKDGKWLSIANAKGTIYLYETESYNLNKILKGASGSINDLKVFDDQIVVGYSDGVIRFLDLQKNILKSNSIKLDRYQEQNGINYAILSIDSISDTKVNFTVLKTNRHHKKTSLITNAEKINATWNLKDNKITLKRRILDLSFRKKVLKNFNEKISFRFEDYTNRRRIYHFNNQQYFLNEVNYNMYKLDGKDTIFYPKKHKAPIKGLRYLPSFNIILSFSNDGSIRFWDEKGSYLSVLYLSGQYNFFYQNNDDFYFASKEILNKIGFIYQNTLFAYEQYDIYYNRPDEVMKHLSYFDKEDIDDYKRAYLKRLDKLGILVNSLSISNSLPEIALSYLDEYSTKKELVKFSLSMKDLKGNIIAYSYLINGIEKRIELLSPINKLTEDVEIRLSSGINKIEFYCVNDKGIKSLIKKKIITCEKKLSKPNLYIVSIGVTNYNDKEFNLKYPKIDAQDIAVILSENKKFDSIQKRTFYNENFTKDSFKEISNFLKESKINDVIVLFYAGHGVLDDEFNYYLSTYNMNFSQPANEGLLFDDIENLFENLSCRNKLIMIDACFSGEIDKSSLKFDTLKGEKIDDIQFRNSQSAAIDLNGEMGIFELSKRTFIDLRVSKGTNILSSASGIEYAQEGDKWGNGLFTYVLKKGIIDKEADLNDDKQIRIMELQVYLRETVSVLSNGNQNPILRKENIKNNFVIW